MDTVSDHAAYAKARAEHAERDGRGDETLFACGRRVLFLDLRLFYFFLFLFLLFRKLLDYR